MTAIEHDEIKHHTEEGRLSGAVKALRQAVYEITKINNKKLTFDLIVMKHDLYRSLFESAEQQLWISEETDNLLSFLYGIPVMTGKTGEEVASICVTQSCKGKRVVQFYLDQDEIRWHAVPTREYVLRTEFEKQRFMHDNLQIRKSMDRSSFKDHITAE
jgi:hypothetical protein